LEPQAGHRSLQRVFTQGSGSVSRLRQAFPPGFERRSILIEESPESVIHVYALAVRHCVARGRKGVQSTVVVI